MKQNEFSKQKNGASWDLKTPGCSAFTLRFRFNIETAVKADFCGCVL